MNIFSGINGGFMKKFLLSLCLSSCISVLLSAASIETYLDNSTAEKLKSKGSVTYIHSSGDNSLALVPDCEYSDVLKKNTVEKTEGQVPFTAEFLYLIPKSQLLENSSKNDVTIDDVSVVLRSISKMEGMRYHFKEKKNGDVLYKSAYTIDSLNSDKRIPDQIEGSADGKVLYCYQKDHTYGDIKYILRYHQKGDVVYANFTTTNDLSYVGIKAVEQGKLKLNVLSIDCGDSILFYISTDVDAKKIPLFNVRNKIEESMTERMDAIYRWFLLQFN
jgi:hypothetical protein